MQRRPGLEYWRQDVGCTRDRDERQRQPVQAWAPNVPNPYAIFSDAAYFFFSRKSYLHTSFSGLLWKSIIYHKALRRSLEPLQLTSCVAILQYADDLLICSPTRDKWEKIQSSSWSTWLLKVTKQAFLNCNLFNSKLSFFDMWTNPSLPRELKQFKNCPKQSAKSNAILGCVLIPHNWEMSFPIMRTLRLHWVTSFT